MKDDIILNPFTISLDLEDAYTVKKGEPIPFNLIERNWGRGKEEKRRREKSKKRRRIK